MTLMNAPAYDIRRAQNIKAGMIGLASLIALLIVLTLLGYILGHGWLFTNLPTEHKVSEFYTALENKDFAKAYGIYQNDPTWQQHPDKYRYSLARFTEDWTKPDYSPVRGPVTSHHIDVSRTDGSGTFGTGIIVAATVNGQRGIDIYVTRADGTMAYPAPHVIEY